MIYFDPTGAIPDTVNVLSGTGSDNFIVSPGTNYYCDRDFTLTLYDNSGTKISSCVFYQPAGQTPYIVNGSNGWNISVTKAIDNYVTVTDECSTGWYISTSDSWISTNKTSGSGSSTSVTISVTANTSTSSRTGYVYLRAGSSSSSSLYYTYKVTQVGAASKADPSWNATAQSQTSTGEFSYMVRVTDADSVG